MARPGSERKISARLDGNPQFDPFPTTIGAAKSWQRGIGIKSHLESPADKIFIILPEVTFPWSADPNRKVFWKRSEESSTLKKYKA